MYLLGKRRTEDYLTSKAKKDMIHGIRELGRKEVNKDFL